MISYGPSRVPGARDDTAGRIILRVSPASLEVPMKATNVIGLVLVGLGVALLLAGGFSYKKNEQILDAGPLQASMERTKHVSVPPIVSGTVLVAGVALLFIGARQRT